jgi:hypothetical protein
MAEGFVGISEAAAMLGVTRLTLRRSIRRDGLVLYSDPLDSRKR